MNNITSDHWDEFHLNSLNTNDGKPKIIATTLAFRRISWSAMSLVLIGKKLSRDVCPPSSGSN